MTVERNSKRSSATALSPDAQGSGNMDAGQPAKQPRVNKRSNTQNRLSWVNSRVTGFMQQQGFRSGAIMPTEVEDVPTMLGRAAQSNEPGATMAVQSWPVEEAEAAGLGANIQTGTFWTVEVEESGNSASASDEGKTTRSETAVVHVVGFYHAAPGDTSGGTGSQPMAMCVWCYTREHLHWFHTFAGGDGRSKVRVYGQPEGKESIDVCEVWGSPPAEGMRPQGVGHVQVRKAVLGVRVFALPLAAFRKPVIGQHACVPFESSEAFVYAGGAAPVSTGSAGAGAASGGPGGSQDTVVARPTMISFEYAVDDRPKNQPSGSSKFAHVIPMAVNHQACAEAIGMRLLQAPELHVPFMTRCVAAPLKRWWNDTIPSCKFPVTQEGGGGDGQEALHTMEPVPFVLFAALTMAEGSEVTYRKGQVSVRLRQQPPLPARLWHCMVDEAL
jgi:hypothetical protein